MISSAKEVVGVTKKQTKTPCCPIVGKLSDEQKDLRLRIKNSRDAKQELKKQRNKVLAEIKTRLKNIKEQEFESRTSEIENLKDSAQMFRSVREMTRERPDKVIIKNSNGDIFEPEEGANIIADYFRWS